MQHIKLFEQFINEKEIYSNLELVGPNADDILDAINALNGTQISGKAFKFRDNVKLNPVDKTGHVISANKVSIEVVPTLIKSPMPAENLYIREANQFLVENKYSSKLYKIK